MVTRSRPRRGDRDISKSRSAYHPIKFSISLSPADVEQAYQEERLHFIIPRYAHARKLPSFFFILAVRLERCIDILDPRVTATRYPTMGRNRLEDLPPCLAVLRMTGETVRDEE